MGNFIITNDKIYIHIQSIHFMVLLTMLLDRVDIVKCWWWLVLDQGLFVQYYYQ